MTVRQTDRRTDGHTDNGDFIGPSVEWGSNKGGLEQVTSHSSDDKTSSRKFLY